MHVLSARADQAADEKAAFHALCEGRDNLVHALGLRVGVHQRAVRRRAAAFERHFRRILVVGDAGKNAKAVVIKLAHHRRHGGLIHVFHAHRTYADTSGAHPVGNASAFARQREYVAVVFGDRVRHIQKP